ncbi:MAG: hypothetical protein ACHQXK_07385 [Methanosarcina thermophila]
MVRTAYKYTDEVLETLANSLMTWARANAKMGNFCLLGDWCFANDFNPKYFSRYIEKHEEFKDAYEYAKAWQEHCVAKGALEGDLDSGFSKFFMACNHNWRTQDVSDAQQALGNEFTKFNANMDILYKITKTEE